MTRNSNLKSPCKNISQGDGKKSSFSNADTTQHKDSSLLSTVDNNIENANVPTISSSAPALTTDSSPKKDSGKFNRQLEAIQEDARSVFVATEAARNVLGLGSRQTVFFGSAGTFEVSPTKDSARRPAEAPKKISFPLDVTAFQRATLTTLARMEVKLDDIAVRMQELELDKERAAKHKSESVDVAQKVSMSEIAGVSIPFEDVKAFKDLEQILEDKTVKAEAKKILKRRIEKMNIRSTHDDDIVKEVVEVHLMDWLFSPKLALMCSKAGQRGKTKLKDTNYVQLLTDAIIASKVCAKNPAVKHVLHVAGEYLRNGKRKFEKALGIKVEAEEKLDSDEDDGDSDKQSIDMEGKSEEKKSAGAASTNKKRRVHSPKKSNSPRKNPKRRKRPQKKMQSKATDESESEDFVTSDDPSYNPTGEIMQTNKNSISLPDNGEAEGTGTAKDHDEGGAEANTVDLFSDSDF